MFGSVIILGAAALFAKPACSVAAFVPSHTKQPRAPAFSNVVSTTGPLPVHGPADVDTVTSLANDFWLATIDSDVASIPTNEFATVFAGGIAVMIGGAVSTAIVGLVLEKAESFANLAAQAYLQGEDPDELWDSLSEDEKDETIEMIQKLVELEVGDDELTLERVMEAIELDGPLSSQGDTEEPIAPTPNSTGERAAPAKPMATTNTADSVKKPKDLFSDYGD